jgi:hypothetical protein
MLAKIGPKTGSKISVISVISVISSEAFAVGDTRYPFLLLTRKRTQLICPKNLDSLESGTNSASGQAV